MFRKQNFEKDSLKKRHWCSFILDQNKDIMKYKFGSVAESQPIEKSRPLHCSPIVTKMWKQFHFRIKANKKLENRKTKCFRRFFLKKERLQLAMSGLIRLAEVVHKWRHKSSSFSTKIYKMSSKTHWLFHLTAMPLFKDKEVVDSWICENSILFKKSEEAIFS